jgi:hypothetical protein
MGRSRKPLGEQSSRGFESLSLRQRALGPEEGRLALDRAAEIGRKRFQLLAARHQVLQRFDIDLCLGEGAERPASIQHGEAIADRVGVAHIVGEKESPQTFLAQPEDVFQRHGGLRDDSDQTFMLNALAAGMEASVFTEDLRERRAKRQSH